MTILYVDDDDDDLQLFEEAIKEIDSSIVCLLKSAGKEALELLENGLLPDLIFLDVNMPEMDGVTCLAKIRENERFCDLKVILLSVSPYTINKERVRSFSADFLTKPTNYEDLLKVLKRVLLNVKT